MTATPPAKRPRRKFEQLTLAEQRVRRWVLANPNRMQEIAERLGVSHQFVQRLAYGRKGDASRGFRVERALKDAGCPGVKIG